MEVDITWLLKLKVMLSCHGPGLMVHLIVSQLSDDLATCKELAGIDNGWIDGVIYLPICLLLVTHNIVVSYNYRLTDYYIK